MTGACMCGFSSIALANNENENPDPAGVTQYSNSILIQTWISNLLSNYDEELDAEVNINFLNHCSIVHYEDHRMYDVLSPFIGDLEGIIGFLEGTWGRKIDYDRSTRTLIADENKNHCVCPIIDDENQLLYPAICYCSEGFAEKLFSAVAGAPASAMVTSSIQRGDERCIYKIKIE